MQELRVNYNAKTGQTEYVNVEVSQEELAQRERDARIYQLEHNIRALKQELNKFKEDVEQVELFGMERADYVQKKARCAEIIIELRKLEREVRDVN